LTLSGAGTLFLFSFTLLENERVDETALAIPPIAAPAVARFSSREGAEGGGSGNNIVLSGLGRRLCDTDVDGRGAPRRGL